MIRASKMRSDGKQKQKLTEVPRLLQALGRVDVGEGLLERLVICASQAVLVEVVAGGYDEVDAELLPNLPHLHCKPLDSSSSTSGNFYRVHNSWIIFSPPKKRDRSMRCAGRLLGHPRLFLE